MGHGSARLPDVAAPYGRQTVRLDATLRLIGAALGGAAGERLASALGMHTAGSTLIAHLRDAPAPEPPVPRVLGVDDFAWRRGRRYGTVLVDLERHRIVDILPDHTAASFAAWLTAHAGVEIISRDRGGPYADAARQRAPNATQVTDRFHLVSNLRAAVEGIVGQHPDDVRAAAQLEASAHSAAGATDVGALVVDLRARGFTGTTQSVQRLVRRLMHEQSAGPDASEDVSRGAGGTRAKLPSPRRVSWLLFATDDELEPTDRTFVAALCARAAPLAAARQLTHQFRQMLREHHTAGFLPWLAAAHESPLRSFVRGLRDDFEAVYAAIAFSWSQGQVEGQVHRLKLVKRSKYGRAKFSVFRQRVLAAA